MSKVREIIKMAESNYTYCITCCSTPMIDEWIFAHFSSLSRFHYFSHSVFCLVNLIINNLFSYHCWGGYKIVVVTTANSLNAERNFVVNCPPLRKRLDLEGGERRAERRALVKRDPKLDKVSTPAIIITDFILHVARSDKVANRLIKSQVWFATWKIKWSTEKAFNSKVPSYSKCFT